MSSTSPAGAPDVDRLRLSVLGADGATSHLTVDAAVSPIRLLEALAVGPATLRRLAGDPLRPDLPLAEQEVPSGACLVLEPLHRTGAPDRDPEPGPRPAAAAGGWRVGAALGAVGCFVLAALVVALEVVARIRGDATASGGSTDGEPVLSTDARAVGIAALLLAVLVATGAIRAGRGSAALAPVRVALPPLAGAGVAFASAEAGPGLLLALTAAAVTVAAVAAFLRADRRVGRGSMAETALFVEAVLGALTAAATGTALLTDVPLHACAALVAGAALPVLRLLPAAILRVPERLLLDVDTVAVTAWSPADEVPVGAGDGSVSTRAVGARIRRDRRLLDAAVVGAVGTAVACLAVALPETLDGAPAVLEEEIAGIALAVAVAAGLALTARAVRGRVSKVASVAGAAAVAVVLAAAVLTVPSSDDGTRLGVGLGAAVLGFAVGGLALAWGTGRRSLRWERIGDLVESATVVLTPGLALVAAGGWAWMRSLVS